MNSFEENWPNFGWMESICRRWQGSYFVDCSRSPTVSRTQNVSRRPWSPPTIPSKILWLWSLDYTYLISQNQHILRLLNTNVDGKRKIMYALTEIKGVGRRYANIACKKADVDLNKRWVCTIGGDCEILNILRTVPETSTLMSSSVWSRSSRTLHSSRSRRGFWTDSETLSMAKIRKSCRTASTQNCVTTWSDWRRFALTAVSDIFGAFV